MRRLWFLRCGLPAWGLMLVLLVGCAVRPRVAPEASAEPRPAGDVYVAKPQPPAPEQEREYRLGYGDVLEIKFFNNEEFNTEVTVRPDGRITLQRIGDIRVTDMTPMGLARLISQKYAEILLEPEVTVTVKQFGGNTVYVLGEVRNPGSYVVQRNMTLLRAIATAGGPTNEANLSSVMLIRMLDEKRVSATRSDLTQALARKDPRPDLEVRPYDIVYVPKTFIGNIRTFMTQVYDTVIPPLDLYARSVFWSRAWK
ncbi:MAG: polysaccharide export protein [candidate division KSB1 bacterium]|nr:polysaccharide export protein [candidate division KSB1 bacterium]